MRRFSAIAAAVVTTFAVGASNAAVVVVDDFNNPAASASVSDATGNAGGGVTGAAMATSSGNLATSRTISHEMLTDGDNSSGAFSFVRVGTGGNIPAGSLVMNNGSTVDSKATVSWTLGAMPALGSSVSFFFKVLESNIGFPSENNVLTFTLDGAALTSVNIGQSGNLDLFVGLNAAQIASLSGGGVLMMTAEGTPGWDLALDSFALQIPEPASLALVGLGLLGAGFASRRRQA